MARPMHRLAVYLGLVEDDQYGRDAYDDDYSEYSEYSEPPDLGPAAASSSKEIVTEDGAANKRVMVIYGHDDEANRALFNWLRAVGLEPLEWGHLVQLSGEASPYIGDVLEHAFKSAKAVLAFFTPDEHVAARGVPLTTKNVWRLQARPNVLIEAGMALVTHPSRTVLVVLGSQELPSDLAGRHYIRLNNTSGPLYELANRLAEAGCELNRTGTQWLDPTNFPSRDDLSLSPPQRANPAARPSKATRN